MVPGGHWSKENISSFWKKFKAAQEEEANLTEIKPAEYKVTDIAEVVNAQQHLTLAERNKLKSMLTKFQPLFMGQRGKYKGPPVELELLPDSKPYYGKPFPIPKAYLKVTKDEINRLESIGLLTKVSSSEWAAPTFVIPKNITILANFVLFSFILLVLR
jgi:hypothetical protein